MKFKFLGIEITIRKDYMVIGVIMFIMVLILWGWYLKTNNIEVFDAGSERTEQKTPVKEKGKEINDKGLETSADSLTKELKEPMYININTADVNTLILLYGIGKAKANAIIQYREQNGPFRSIDEIKNVKGIGDATFSKIKDRIIVGTEGRKPYNTDLLK